MPKRWQQGKCRGGLCEERSGQPVPDTAGSSHLQWTHRRARLSPLSQYDGASRKTYSRKDKRLQSREGNEEKNLKEVTLQTPRREEKEEEEVIQVFRRSY